MESITVLFQPGICNDLASLGRNVNQITISLPVKKKLSVVFVVACKEINL